MPKKTDLKKFNEFLLTAIDEALNTLGESVKQSIYFHIKSKFNIQKKDIPDKLPEFQEALEAIFGSGARYIEILIMKQLYTNIGQPIVLENDKELEFIVYINKAQVTVAQATPK